MLTSCFCCHGDRLYVNTERSNLLTEVRESREMEGRERQKSIIRADREKQTKIQADSQTNACKCRRNGYNLSYGQVETLCCRTTAIMRYMGGTDPIRASGIRAKVSQDTNTYTTPRGAQTELHSAHSISEHGLEMYVFHGNNVQKTMKLRRLCSLSRLI